MNFSKDQIESIATVIDNPREILKLYFIFFGKRCNKYHFN